MTFVLKDLSVLIEHFKMTKTVMLQRYKMGSIENLHEPRRSEMLLLEKVLNKLEAKVKDIQTTSRAKPEIIKGQISRLVCVFYGAMLLAKYDAIERTGPGMLTGRLDDALNLNDPEKAKHPSTDDEARFYLALSEFLKTELFNEGNSRLGLKEDHLLSTVKKDHLQRLLTTSYILEKKAQQSVIRSLVADSKKTVLTRDYSTDKKTPDSAISSFKTWPALRSQLKELITQEYVSKRQPTVYALGQPRAAQLHFLEKIEALLLESGIPDREKIAVLAGAMHLIRKQIRDEYTILAPTSSVAHTHLTEILGVNSEHDIDRAKTQDIEALLHAANHFIRYLTVVTKPEAEQKDGVKRAISSANPFASIAGCNIQEILCLFQEMICMCREKASQNVFAAFVDPKASVTPASSWMPSLRSAIGMFGFMPTASTDGGDEGRHSPVLADAGVSPGK